jgi:hypothetical protein
MLLLGSYYGLRILLQRPKAPLPSLNNGTESASCTRDCHSPLTKEVFAATSELKSIDIGDSWDIRRLSELPNDALKAVLDKTSFDDAIALIHTRPRVQAQLLLSRLALSRPVRGVLDRHQWHRSL